MLNISPKSKLCGECAKFHKPECCYGHRSDVVYETDLSCEDFEPKAKTKAKKKENEGWTLELDAEVPTELKPCGFFGDMLIEAAWLPYKSEDQNGTVELRPTLVIKREKNGQIEIQPFLDSDLLNVKGTFPSRDLTTLMGVNAVKMLKSETVIDPKAVDLEIDHMIDKHVELGAKRKIILKRWAEGSYFYDVFGTYPILNIMGVSESGKSRILLIILALAYHSEGVVDPSPASIFRSKEEDKATLCFDEAEYLNDPSMNQTIRMLINASYSRGFSVPRYDEIDGKRVKRRFDLYSPFAIVGISGLEGTTASRAIRIVTQRANADFPKARQEAYADLRDKLYVLRFNLAFELKRVYEEMNISTVVSARFEELFKPLFALTRVFGSEEEFQALCEWAKMYQTTFRVEALNVAQEEQILTSLAQLQPLPDDWYELKTLTDKVNATYSRKLSYQRVSQILSRMGISERRKVKGVTQFRTTHEELKNITERLGIELPEYETEPKQQLGLIDTFLRFKALYASVEKVEKVA